jgi:hypothetical protein
MHVAVGGGDGGLPTRASATPPPPRLPARPPARGAAPVGVLTTRMRAWWAINAYPCSTARARAYDRFSPFRNSRWRTGMEENRWVRRTVVPTGTATGVEDTSRPRRSYASWLPMASAAVRVVITTDLHSSQRDASASPRNPKDATA